MPSVPFGAIKALQARTGADRATCKKALEENGCDEDAAAAAIGEHTSVAAASSSKPSEAQAQLDSWAAQEQAASVSIVRQQAGDGETFPMVGDMCTMHYEGTLQSDGTVFDSSIKRNKPFRFKVGVADVIRGWDVGVMKMSLGEKAVLLIGPDYACTHPLTCMYCRVIHTLHLGTCHLLLAQMAPRGLVPSRPMRTSSSKSSCCASSVGCSAMARSSVDWTRR